ncbi:transketolase family protein [Candidatus Woesearchaeota archaeon]|nr:transketolase family protein [Candidatus Woesearchaeota archaeon]
MQPRDAIADGLLEITKHHDIVVLSPDNAESTRAKTFAKKHPERFIQCGKTEQNMIGIAMGLAKEGKNVYAISHANPGRTFEQLKIASINNSNIKIIGTHAGLSSGKEGIHTLEDISLVRTLQNITIIAPADAHEARKAAIAAAIIHGPTYIRIGREKQPEVTKNSQFTIGKAEIMTTGKDCTIIACGNMVHEALQAAERLTKQDIECTVINNHTIKPLDKHTLLSSAKLTGCVVTAEEATNGLGNAVAELIGQQSPMPMRIIALNKHGQSGTPEELRAHYGLTADHIMTAVKEAILQKCENICTIIPEQHGMIETSFPFRISGGGIIKNIPGLHRALLTMDDTTFLQHCNKNKNDFSTWIREVFKKETLAEELEKKKTRLAMASTLTRWLK